jgi:uncharacterized membrane protein YdjX (TVP38/TMEM64 family)
MTAAHVLRTHGRLLAVLGFVALLLLGVRLTGVGEHFELAALRHDIAGHRLEGVLLFIGLFSLGNLLLIPGWVFLASAVYAFGALAGGLATYAAAVVSCVLTFGVIRLLGGNALRQLKSTLAQRLLRRLDAAPVRCVFALRLIFQTLPALNGALAMSGIRFRHYLVGSLLGLPLPIAIYVLFFDQLAQWLGVR